MSGLISRGGARQRPELFIAPHRLRWGGVTKGSLARNRTRSKIWRSQAGPERPRRIRFLPRKGLMPHGSRSPPNLLAVLSGLRPIESCTRCRTSPDDCSMKASNSSQSTCIAALRSRRSEGHGNGQPRNLKGLHARPSQQRRAAPDRCLVARLQLPLRRHDLSARRPAAQGAAEARAREASPARPLGREPGAVLRVGASQSRHQAG